MEKKTKFVLIIWNCFILNCYDHINIGRLVKILESLFNVIFWMEKQMIFLHKKTKRVQKVIWKSQNKLFSLLIIFEIDTKIGMKKPRKVK